MTGPDISMKIGRLALVMIIPAVPFPHEEAVDAQWRESPIPRA